MYARERISGWGNGRQRVRFRGRYARYRNDNFDNTLIINGL